MKEQEIKNVEIDPDIKKEYENQKRYLENSVNSLKKRLEKETQIHKEVKNAPYLILTNFKMIGQQQYNEGEYGVDKPDRYTSQRGDPSEQPAEKPRL